MTLKILSVRTFFCLLFLTLPYSAEAQEPFWKPMGGWAVAEVKTVTADLDGYVYAAADFESQTGQGGVWRFDLVGSNSARVAEKLGGKNATVLVAADNGFLFAGTAGAGVFRSSDKGDSWEPVGDNGSLWIATMISTENGTLYMGTNSLPGHLYRSTNNGEEWELLFSEATGEISAVAVGQSGTIFAGGVGGLYRSTNNGEEWEKINSEGVMGLAVTENGNVLVGRLLGVSGQFFAGVLRSTDNGTSWEGVVAAQPKVGNAAFLRQILPLPNGHVYAAASNYGVLHSTDNGLTWNPLEFEFDPNNPSESGAYDIRSIAYSPVTKQLFLAVHYQLLKSQTLNISVVEESSQIRLQTYSVKVYPSIVHQQEMLKIAFVIPESQHLRLCLYNTQGEQVAVMDNRLYSEGNHTLTWSVEGVQSGMYYCQLEDEFGRGRGECVVLVQ
ncbi:MAG: hypothetical protein AB7H80_10130 [Candidatus Kapaibacterium sp.]